MTWKKRRTNIPFLSKPIEKVKKLDWMSVLAYKILYIFHFSSLKFIKCVPESKMFLQTSILFHFYLLDTYSAFLFKFLRLVLKKKQKKTPHADSDQRVVYFWLWHGSRVCCRWHNVRFDGICQRFLKIIFTANVNFCELFPCNWFSCSANGTIFIRTVNALCTVVSLVTV